MRFSGRTAVYLIGLLAGAVVMPQSGAAAKAAPAVRGSGATANVFKSLVLPGTQPLIGSQQVVDQQVARRSSPQAFLARLRSRHAYAHLDSAQAASLALQTFPEVGDPAGGATSLPNGARPVRYLDQNAVAVTLPGDRHGGIVESLQPVAQRTSNGSFVPLDLALSYKAGAYVPRRSPSAVRIPKRLAAGLELPGTGISLTPVDTRGAALSGSPGALDGSGVIYANTQQTMDTLVKPAVEGFELLAILRAPEGTSTMRYRVRMPAGDSLEQSRRDARDALVVREGRSLANISAPVAEDAEGTTVPAAMKVDGDTVVVSVASTGSYRYPIIVDPRVTDERFSGSNGPTNWRFCASDDISCAGHSSGKFASKGWEGSTGLTIESIGAYSTNEWVSLNYQTQGESKVGQLIAEASGSSPSGNIEVYSQVVNSEKIENSYILELPPTTSYGPLAAGVCSRPEGHEIECSGEGAKEKNLVRFEASAANTGAAFSDTLSKASVYITQSKNPETGFNTTSSSLPGGAENVLYGEGFAPTRWLGPHANTGFEVWAKDPGIGVSSLTVGAAGWGIDREYLAEGRCSGVQCSPSVAEFFGYNSTMSDGVWSAEALASNATVGGFGTKALATVHVDATPPHELRVLGLPSNDILDGYTYHLEAEAVDGSGSIQSSGVKSLSLGIDGRELVGGKSGACSPGPCSATGEWTISGEEFGAGKHTLTVVATDYAGNVESKPYEITVRHAPWTDLSPGAVDPIAGAFKLEATDATVTSGFGSMSVHRAYNSHELTAGAEGPLGPQWSFGISGERGLEPATAGGSVTLIATDGSRTTFASDGKGGFISPAGDENLTLVAEKTGEAVTAYVLKDPAKGTSIRFVRPSGAGSLWMIEKSEGVLSESNGEKQTYAWESIEEGGLAIERPKQALAPAPEASCQPELTPGCRALAFTYATATTATGEAPSEWGQFKNRLVKISLTAFDPAHEAMTTTAVAEYSYDKQGRLRAEWDPRITPALKTTYGYDGEGRVIAVNTPGQEPWLLHYGTISSDPTPGRLLSVTRPSASTPLGSGPAPSNETKPTLSTTTPSVGTTMSVSANGTWSNSPLVYQYQWVRCNAKGEKCASIAGAVNQTYTPQARDAGYELKATVTALNADGVGSSSTTTTSAIALAAFQSKIAFGGPGEGAGQVKSPVGIGIDPAGKVWISDHANNRLDEFTASGSFIEAVGFGVGNSESKFETCTISCKAGIAIAANGGFSGPDGIAVAGSAIYVADAGNNRIEEMNTNAEFVRAFGTKGSGAGQLSNPEAVAVAPDGDVWVADRGNNRVVEFSETGTYLGSFGSSGAGNGQFDEPSGVAFSGESAYVVDTGNDRVQQFTDSGSYVSQFGSAGTGNGQFSAPAEIATEPVSEDLLVADNKNNRIQVFSPLGGFLTSIGGEGETLGKFKGVEGVVANSEGQIYATDLNNNRAQQFSHGYSTSNPAPAPPSVGASAVWTVEYQVPVSGSSAPYAMEASEVERWAQKEDPGEATAIFPPDEPMGWPAQDYKRASISYFDEFGRVVNTASPGGGVTTTEYDNTTDNVSRTLSAANRARALAEGAKSAEVATLLDTKDTYNGPDKKLSETVGPEHLVKIAATGKEVRAREHAFYSYNEGAPEGGPYDLVTKVSRWAQSSEGTKDNRSTKYGYSGQNNLGWKLRKPTSVTIDSAGLKIVHTTLYDPVSGKPVETRGPTGGTGGVIAGGYGYGSQITMGAAPPLTFGSPNSMTTDSKGDVWLADTSNNQVVELSEGGEFLRKFGSLGTENGKLKEPRGIAIDSKGNVWVADTGNSRVEEFSSTGAYLSKFGSLGSENGQLREPKGITFDPKGKIWVVDAGNSRVQEFSSVGAYEKKFGAPGTGNGQFKEPFDIVMDSKEDLWVSDIGNNRVQELSTAGTYLGQVGGAGTENGQLKSPHGLTMDSKGDLWVADSGNNRVQEFSGTGAYIWQFGVVGAKNGQFVATRDVVVNSQGYIWVSDATARVQEFLPSGEYLRNPFNPQAPLQKPEGIAVSKERIWVVDSEANTVEVFTLNGAFVMSIGGSGTENGKFKAPRAIAFDAKGNAWIVDTGNDRVQEFSSSGEYLSQFGSAGTENGKLKEPRAIVADKKEHLWVTDFGNNRVQEFSLTGVYLGQFGTTGTENGQFKGPTGIAVDSKENLWVADGSNSRVEEFSSTGAFESAFGSVGVGPGQLLIPAGIAIDASGRIWVSDALRIQQFSSSGEYIREVGSIGTGEGQLKSPKGIAFDPSGNAWVADSGNKRVEEFSLVVGSPSSAQTIYYTASGDPEAPSCGRRPEWSGLPCRSQPASQPTKGSRLPVVTDTYNVWDETAKVTEEFGSVVRTKQSGYDAAGRLTSNEVTSSVDTPLPKVSYEYNQETGARDKQETVEGGKAQAILSVYDKLGNMIEYVDADGNKTKYQYEVDGQVEEMSDGKDTQMYSYDPTTKTLTKLLDTAAGSFTASYELEGKIATETYPDGLTAKYSYNELGMPTRIEYVKETHCSEACVWFSETMTYSIYGEALVRAGTFANDSYTYDGDGRLTQVQETPAGQGCKVRVYAYDEESNRLGLTTREPAAEGKCASSGGVTESHVYDEANRLADAGTSYEAFGNATALPAIDAGGHELTSTYYVSNQARSTTQNGETVTYGLDPDGRAREVVSAGTTNSTVVNHYPGPGEAVAWTSEGSEKFTQNIPGIDGALGATEKNGERPVLQIHDLEGDVVAQASLSETETKLIASYMSTEFGVPTTASPPTYSWLGAGGYSANFASGVSGSHGASYVPQLGGTLQTQPLASPAKLPDGTWSLGPYVAVMEGWVGQSDAAWGAESSAREAARQRLREEEEMRRSLEEAVDPNALLHLTLSEAWAEVNLIAKALLGVKIASAVSELGSTVTEAGIGIVISYFTSGIIEEWFSNYGGLLEECVENLTGSKHPNGACRVSMPVDEWFSKRKLPNFFLTPEVSWCKGWDGEHVHWCTLLNKKGKGTLFLIA